MPTGILLPESPGSELLNAVASINGDTTAAQALTVGTGGNDFNITDPGAGSHVFNLPSASASKRGALTSADWTTFNAKIGGSLTATRVPFASGSATLTDSANFTWASNTLTVVGDGIFGAAASVSSKLSIRETSTLTVGTRNGAGAELYLNAAADSSAQFSAMQYTLSDAGGTAGKTYSGALFGVNGLVNLSLGNTYSNNGINGSVGQVSITNATMSGTARGIFGNVSAVSGTVNVIEAGRFGLNVTGATVTTGMGLHVRAITGPLTGSIGTSYAALFDSPGLGTNQWTVVSSGGNNAFVGSTSFGKATVPNAQVDILQATATSGLPTAFVLTGAAHNGIDGENYTSALFDFGQTVIFAQNDRTQFQNVLFNPSTYAFAGASNLTFASNVVVNGVPGQGANANITAAIALQVNGGLASNTGGAGIGTYVGLPGIANEILGMQALQALTIGLGSGNQVSLGNQTSTLVDLIYTSIMPDTVVSAVHTRTVSGTIAGLYLSGPPVAGANVTFSATAYTIFSDSGLNRFDGDGTNVFELPADATGNVTAAVGRIPIKVGGVTKYLRYYND